MWKLEINTDCRLAFNCAIWGDYVDRKVYYYLNPFEFIRRLRRESGNIIGSSYQHLLSHVPRHILRHLFVPCSNPSLFFAS